MYAVIETGGKQYRDQQGQRLKVEKIERATGDSIEFDKVLLVGGEDGAKIGKPYLEGGKVTAAVVAKGRSQKSDIIKLRRRKEHQKRAGHRQWYTEIKITGINA